MSRIAAVSALLLILPVMGWAKEWNFNVSLDGKPIGEHRFVLDETGNQKQLSSEARFNVKFLFLMHINTCTRPTRNGRELA